MAYSRHQAWVGPILLLGLMSACSAKSDDQAAASPAATSAKRVMSVSLDQIQNQLSNDHAAAVKTYSETAVQFTSNAATVSPEADGAATITFTTAEHPQPVTAHFTSATDRPAAAVKPGDTVQAKCETVAEVAGKVELTGCIVRVPAAMPS